MDSRSRLIQTAADLFLRRSYASVGVDELCAHAGVNKGSFYHFFPSKLELALAVIDAHWDAFEQSGLRDARALNDPLKRVQYVFEYTYEAQAQIRRVSGQVVGCPWGNLAAELSTAAPAVRERIRDVFRRLERFFEETLSVGVSRGELEIGDVRLAARALVAYYEGVLVVAKTANDPRVIRHLAPSVNALTQLGKE